MYSAWVHILVIRLFVESVLRYGLPPGFVAGVMRPKPRSEKKLRGLLEGFGDEGNSRSFAGLMSHEND